MGDILAGRSWEGNRPFIVTCIVEGMEMGKPRSGSHMVKTGWERRVNRWCM